MKEDQHDRNALQLLQRTKVNEVAHRGKKDFDQIRLGTKRKD